MPSSSNAVNSRLPFRRQDVRLLPVAFQTVPAIAIAARKRSSACSRPYKWMWTFAVTAGDEWPITMLRVLQRHSSGVSPAGEGVP
jgi:hypothetical protein